MVQVKTGHASAATEHTAHVCHLRCVEMTHIKARDICTVTEHITHVRHVIGLQILNACYRLELFTTVEPIGRAGEACIISKRTV